MRAYSVKARTGKKKKAQGSEPTDLITSQAEKTDFVAENHVSLKQVANGSPPPPNTILHLQRTIGNQAVQRLLNTAGTSTIQRCNGDENCGCSKCAANRQADEPVQRSTMIQRCNDNENCTCPKCAANRQAQSGAPADDPTVQRVMGDGHDLTATPIAGDTQLEDAYDGDNSKYVRSGAKGEVVKKVQSALLQVGQPLPEYGPDGDFGSETRNAVKDFQSSKSIDDDGIVGKDTLAELDKALVGGSPAPKPLPGEMPAHTDSDFKIDHIGTSTEEKIFFARNQARLTIDARIIIEDIANAAPSSVRLLGFASGEEDPALADARAKVVEAALKLEGITVTEAKGNAAATAKNSDFSDARSVEVLVGNAKETTLDCEAKHENGPKKGQLKNPATAPCAEMDPETETAFTNAMTVANDAMSKAVSASDVSDSKYNPALVKKFFGNDDPATLAALKVNMSNLKNHVANLPSSTQCGSKCDIGMCDSSTIAYNSGVDSASKMTLCSPNFKEYGDEVRNASILIHEGAHGTTPLGGTEKTGADDLAYRHERIILQLSPQDRLRNSDNYALFAMYAREVENTGDPDAKPAGIDSPHTENLINFTDNAEKDAMHMALAQCEKRIQWCTDHIGQMYGELLEVKNGEKTWNDTWAKTYMYQAADRFPVTRPPANPTTEDQAIIAAVIDRYKHMKASIKTDLQVTRETTGVVTWAKDGAKAADNFSVGDDYFKATPENQISLLLEAIANATADVEPAFVPGYVSFARWIHENA
jgi:hypothetical protein